MSEDTELTKVEVAVLKVAEAYAGSGSDTVSYLPELYTNLLTAVLEARKNLIQKH